MQQTPAGQPQPPQGGYYAYSSAAPQPQGGYYSQGYGAAGRAPVMTAAAKKPNYTMIGVISVAVVAVIVVAIILVVVLGGNPLVGTWFSEDYGYDMTVTFRKNGIVVVENAGYEETAKYRVRGNKVTFFVDGSEDTGQFIITKEKGKTVLILSFYGDEMKLYKK
jgi:hypothetical protein